MSKTIHTLTVIAIMIELSERGPEGQVVDTQNVESGTRTRCHQNSLERMGSSTRWDGGKHGAG